MVEAETPVWAHQRGLSDLSILSGDIARRWSGNEVEVKDTSNDVVLEVLAVLVIQVDVHGIGVQQKDTMGVLSSVVKVDWVGT